LEVIDQLEELGTIQREGSPFIVEPSAARRRGMRFHRKSVLVFLATK